jgi:heme exporter protein B
MPDFALALAVARRDLIQEFRSKSVIVATIFFSCVTVIILAFALGPAPDDLRRAAPGILWVALTFAGVISAAQSYQTELEDGAFEQLLISPIPRSVIYIGKLLANWLEMLILGIVLLIVTSFLFDVRLEGGLLLMLATLGTGSLGFSLIATFYAALTTSLPARELLLPVLTLPVIVPILLAAVRATAIIFGSGEGTPALAGSWVQLILGFDLIYLVVCTALFPFVVEE